METDGGREKVLGCDKVLRRILQGHQGSTVSQELGALVPSYIQSQVVSHLLGASCWQKWHS